MILGIDLGTTNSLAAVFKDGRPEIIPNRLQKKLTPSVVAINEEGQILVGETAREYGALHPKRAARVFKRTMGTDQKYVLGDQEFDSSELSSFVLRSLKEDAEVYLQEEVEEAIVSVPAYFNDRQRKDTVRAGELAGLKISRIINEPTASALAYGVGKENKNERCMVFDLGGGTFDVTILEYYQNIMEVYAIAGDNFLGGEDFTAILQEMFLERTQLNPLAMDLRTLQQLYKSAENAKCAFSESDVVSMRISFRDAVYTEEFTKAEYEEALLPLLERLAKPIEKALRDAKCSLDELDRVILVGGATRLDIVRDYVEKILHIKPQYTVNPDTAVAEGAALQCAMKERDEAVEEVILTDVCPFTLGTEVIRDNGAFEVAGHYLPIIERNTVIPVSRKQTVYTAHDNQSYVNVKILQGESRLARNNLLLGEINVEVPVGPKGKEAVEITYTYDVDALLEVEVEVLSTGLKKKVIIQNEENKISEEEAEERFRKLSYLKQNPREDEETVLTYFRAERMYEEADKEEREKIADAIAAFDQVLQKQFRPDIEKERKKLNTLLDQLEKDDEKVFLS